MPGREVALLGALLLLALSPGFIESPRYLYSEVVVPRQLDMRDIYDREEDVSYIIKMEDLYRMVHLKRMSFMTSNTPLYSYNTKGDLLTDYPYIQTDCYYSGYVDDIPDSEAVLSNCIGLWGYMEVGGLRYEIEPIQDSPSFQHLIYRKTPWPREPCGGILEVANESGELRIIDTDVDDNPLPSDMQVQDYEYYPATRYLEYYAVIDRSKYINENRNESRTVWVILQMMAIVHKVYLEIGLRIYLVGLELWKERDYIAIGTEKLALTLSEFYYYATYELRHRVQFDHSGIIVGTGEPHGLALGEHFCLYNHASVSAIRSYNELLYDAETMAHVLGHSLGFNHDDTKTNKVRGCDCNCTKLPGGCIMFSGNITCQRLSNCSRQSLYDTIRKPGKECFLNIPSKAFQLKMCGNGIMEDDEECDCGVDKQIYYFDFNTEDRAKFITAAVPGRGDAAASSRKEPIAQWNYWACFACGSIPDKEDGGEGIASLFLTSQFVATRGKSKAKTKQSKILHSFAKNLQAKDFIEGGQSGITSSLSDHSFPDFKGPNECRRHGCCLKNCKLKADIDCLYGLCCDKCKFLEEGIVCREASSECDLPEYCNGTSADCPPDVFKQDGMPCGTKNNCYRGKCLNHRRHCRTLFGKDAVVAPLTCFKEVNMRGDRSGNCGEDGQKFRKCKEEDVLCGRIQCTNLARIPKMSSGQGVIQTPMDNILCWGTEFHYGQDVYDLGAVRDGTTCGTDKICINRSCIDLAVLDYDCDFSKCHYRGVSGHVAHIPFWVNGALTCSFFEKVCNNKRNCHCRYGWSPPFCDGRGYGGSIDSGPAPAYAMSTGLIVGIAFLVALTLLAVFSVAVFKRGQLGAWLDRVTRKERAPSKVTLPNAEDTASAES